MEQVSNAIILHWKAGIENNKASNDSLAQCSNMVVQDLHLYSFLLPWLLPCPLLLQHPPSLQSPFVKPNIDRVTNTALSSKLMHLVFVMFNEKVDVVRSISPLSCNYLLPLQFIQELSLTIITFPPTFPSVLFKWKIISYVLAKETKYDFMVTTKITNLIIVNYMAAIMAYSKFRKY